MEVGDADPELQNLLSFYPDIEPALVAKIWKECNLDYKAAMEALAEIARNPAAAFARLSKPTNPQEVGISLRPSAEDARVDGEDGGGSVSGMFDSPSELNTSVGWDNAGVMISETLNTMGESVMQAATSVTTWFADLASVFETVVDDEEEEGATGRSHSADKTDYTEVVASGGVDVGRLQHRRIRGSEGGSAAMAPSTRAGEEDPGLDDYFAEQDLKKDE